MALRACGNPDLRNDQLSRRLSEAILAKAKAVVASRRLDRQNKENGEVVIGAQVTVPRDGPVVSSTADTDGISPMRSPFSSLSSGLASALTLRRCSEERLHECLPIHAVR